MLFCLNVFRIHPTHSKLIEVHLFDFQSTIYNERLKIEFIERIRGEKKFSDLNKLKSQLKIDATNCKKTFNLLR